MVKRDEIKNLPRHIGFIMDGNGRWAKKRGLPRLAGHRAGAENLRRILRACGEWGIKYVTIYAFSTENWGRPEEEVKGLFSLMEQFIDRELPELMKNGVQVRHIGRMDGVPERLQEKIRYLLESTKDNDKLILCIALNYGGRAEIVDAVRRIIAEGYRPEEVDEELISRYLYTAGIPDPDLIIRTAGEMRISNFLLWQSAYAEYYSTPTFWPDFNEQELYKALLDYSRRERRFGLVKEG
ncbi:MAG: isoprenyl transferase [Chloroflexi bacterium]|nr:MAG: isoprenyl transferase [Chloroflexota bacterium]HDN79980.1 isoprenyl transferase [Chloroflexota bacterium]